VPDVAQISLSDKILLCSEWHFTNGVSLTSFYSAKTRFDKLIYHEHFPIFPFGENAKDSAIQYYLMWDGNI